MKARQSRRVNGQFRKGAPNLARRKQLLRGQKFGRWKVIKLDIEKTKKAGRLHYVVQCDCPKRTTKTVISSSLLRGVSKSCGCLTVDNNIQRCRKDLVGERFGRGVVQSYKKTKSKRAYWELKCDCGKIYIAPTNHLRSGNTTSCGCYQKEVRNAPEVILKRTKAKDFSGQKQGFLNIHGISSKIKNGKLWWEATCELCGKETTVSQASLSRGKKSCGCLIGQYARERTARGELPPKSNGRFIKRKVKGRPPSASTSEIYQRCYEGITEGFSLNSIVKKLAEEFPEPDYSPPKTAQDVSSFAKRYAKKHKKTWPIKREIE